MEGLIRKNFREEIEQVIERLDCATICEFSELPGPTAIPAAKGIYIIFDKNSKKVLYVGKTTNLRQRLYHNHLMGPISNARLKKYLLEDEGYPEITDLVEAKKYIRNHCSFLYLLEDDFRERGHLEGLVSFICNCYYVDLEH